MSGLSLDASLDDLIKSRKSAGAGAGGGASGGAMRGKFTSRKSRVTPYGSSATEGRRGGANGTRGDGDSTVCHVGNIPFTCSWRELKDHLASAGDVLRVEIASKPDGSSRGFATASFGSVRAARTAIATLHESNFMGRTIVVREMSRGSGGGKGAGRVGAGSSKKFGSVETEDGYSASGSRGKNGWVKPDHTKFVDNGPPPEPRANALER